MAFRLPLRAGIEDGFLKIGLAEISKASRRLETTAGDPSGIHEARKSLKRLRALLRLVRPGLNGAAFRDENARFRAIAALIAPSRDRFVVGTTLTKLQSAADPHAIAAARAALAGDKDGSFGEEDRLRRCEEAHVRLAAAVRPFRRLAIEPDRFEIAGAGLKKSYRAARRAFARAYDDPTSEAFHAWRKEVQRHWRHMALLSLAWPDVMAARVAEARTLSRLLGEDHDLDMLAAFAAAHLASEDARCLSRLCAERQRLLRKLARSRGDRLFAERPRRLSRRVERYWHAAREMHKSEKAKTSSPAATRPSVPA